jgi:hypothetical protein
MDRTVGDELLAARMDELAMQETMRAEHEQALEVEAAKLAGEMV